MDQIPLFAEPLPAGLLYLPDIIAPDEERRLLEMIRALPFEPYLYGPYTALREVVLIEAPLALPDFILPLRARVARETGRAESLLTSVLFTHYAKGVGIGWHHDAPMYDEVFGISLLGRCTMDFRLRRGDGYVQNRLILEPRSAYALTGPARQRWQHRLTPVQTERYSVTFRTAAT